MDPTIITSTGIAVCQAKPTIAHATDATDEFIMWSVLKAKVYIYIYIMDEYMTI